MEKLISEGQQLYCIGEIKNTFITMSSEKRIEQSFVEQSFVEQSFVEQSFVEQSFVEYSESDSKKNIEMDDARKIIIKTPKNLPKIIKKIHPHFYGFADGVFGCVVQSGDIDMLKWYINYMKDQYSKTNDAYFKLRSSEDLYEYAIRSNNTKMLEYVESITNKPLHKCRDAFTIAGEIGSKDMINYLLENEIPQERSAYIKATHHNTDFLDFLFSKNIIYDENAFLEALHYCNLGTLDWFHKKGFECNKDDAFLHAVYGARIESVSWLKNNGYKCNSNFCKWEDLDEDYFEGDIWACLKWLVDNGMITKGLKKLNRVMKQYI